MDEQQNWQDEQHDDAIRNADGDDRAVDEENMMFDPSMEAAKADVDFAGPPPKSNHGALLIALVLAIGAGSLYAMRMAGGAMSGDGTIAEAEQRVEMALARLAGKENDGPDTDAGRLAALFKDTDDVLAMFANDPTAKQVKVEQLQKNPFELTVVRKVSPDSKDVETVDREQELQMKRIRDELQRMDLQTIMSGRVPMAVVSGKVVREGDQFGSFTVTAIRPQKVELSAEGNTYTLTMKESSPES